MESVDSWNIKSRFHCVWHDDDCISISVMLVYSVNVIICVHTSQFFFNLEFTQHALHILFLFLTAMFCVWSTG
jgi:hypothetical protein